MKKFFRRTGLVIVFLIVLFEVGLITTGNWYVNKVLRMTIFSGKMGPDIDELNLFPYHEVKSGKTQAWPKSAGYNQSVLGGDLLAKIIGYKTVAFLVIKDDSILNEQYWEGYNEESVANSFSMAKSINSILIGCALKDGLIQSIDQPVGDFIDSYQTGEKAKITIRHLLTMSSGLDFKEEYVSPLAWPAEAYYGSDVNGLTLKANVKEAPGKTWNYKGGDSQLLGIILKKVTGKSIAEYAEEKLWKPIGAEDKAFWSTDDKGMEKVSCCFYTNARDYAKIAKLYLNNGNWNGNQIVDSAFVKESVSIAPLLDKNGLPNDKYGFQWWLMNYKHHAVFYMRGIRGQYVFAIPDLKMIIIRLGHKRAPKAGDEIPADIYTYLDAAMQLAQVK